MTSLKDAPEFVVFVPSPTSTLAHFTTLQRQAIQEEPPRMAPDQSRARSVTHTPTLLPHFWAPDSIFTPPSHSTPPQQHTPASPLHHPLQNASGEHPPDPNFALRLFSMELELKVLHALSPEPTVLATFRYQEPPHCGLT